MWKLKLAILFVAYFFVPNEGQQRIAGGDTTVIANYPFKTSLLTNEGTGDNYQHRCGGSILSANAILSAASCFYTGTTLNPAAWWRARVGSSFSNAGGTVHDVASIIPNPGFLTTTRANDLAVLRTAQNINLQPGVAQAAFIAAGTFTLTNNQPVWAVGWGHISTGTPSPSAQLRDVQFWVINQTTCANRYGETGFTVTDNMVCVGWLDVGIRGQCQGDEGSPLVINGVVVGVYSWTNGCAQGWYPNINTRITPYTQWIVSAANSQQ